MYLFDYIVVVAVMKCPGKNQMYKNCQHCCSIRAPTKPRSSMDSHHSRTKEEGAKISACSVMSQ